jgi:hypothetical protein
MYQIQQVTNAPLQKQTLVLPDGTFLSMSTYFRPMQFGWFIKELSYALTSRDFILRELRICNSPNMLHQWRNILPFGLGCFSSQDREPTQQDDFISGANTLYILTAEEVAEFAGLLQNG